MDFEGVPIQNILERAKLKPTARFVVVHAEQGYTTNLPLEVLDDDDVMLADIADGAPLTPDHGYPLRLVVPKRYFWKSAKWVRGLQFTQVDKPGFWERYGYNNNADPGRKSASPSKPYWRAIATRKTFLGRDQVVGVLGVLAQVDLDPVHFAGENVAVAAVVVGPASRSPGRCRGSRRPRKPSAWSPRRALADLVPSR